ncbi:MAG: nucleotidyltransferase domain-containing protein [Pseudomonadota bacterium]
MHATVRARLARIAGAGDALILLAVVSGSRARGLPAPDSDDPDSDDPDSDDPESDDPGSDDPDSDDPDSDDDMRFVYARPVDWPPGVAPGRDAIERPIDAMRDLSGWDLRTTPGLILKSGAVAAEWLPSPLRCAQAPASARQPVAHRAAADRVHVARTRTMDGAAPGALGAGRAPEPATGTHR